MRRLRAQFNAEALLNTVQAIALISGGCWALFRFFAHERQTNELQLRQQELAYRQASATLHTEVRAADARLQQLRLSNRQAEISLSAQRELTEATVTQQRLTNEQAAMTLEIAKQERQLRREELEQTVALKRAELEHKQLEQTKLRAELVHASVYRFEREFWFDGRKLRDVDETTAEYAFYHGFRITNRSQATFEMSLFILDYYIGVPKARVARKAVEPLGTPPDRWNPGSTQPGALEWTLIDTTGSIRATAANSVAAPWNSVVRDLKLVRGGAGTSSLRTDQSVVYGDDYFVTAPKHAYIAFVMSYCFNLCSTNDDLKSHIEWRSLAKLESGTPTTAGTSE